MKLFLLIGLELIFMTFLYEDLFVSFSLQPLAPAIQMLFLDSLGKFNNQVPSEKGIFKVG